MRTTLTLAANYGCSPFEIMGQDTDDVILLINYYIEAGNAETKQESVKTKEKRIRVNDKTATNGWF